MDVITTKELPKDCRIVVPTSISSEARVEKYQDGTISISLYSRGKLLGRIDAVNDQIKQFVDHSKCQVEEACPKPIQPE